MNGIKTICGLVAAAVLTLTGCSSNSKIEEKVIARENNSVVYIGSNVFEETQELLKCRQAGDERRVEGMVVEDEYIFKERFKEDGKRFFAHSYSLKVVTPEGICKIHPYDGVPVSHSNIPEFNNAVSPGMQISFPTCKSNGESYFAERMHPCHSCFYDKRSADIPLNEIKIVK